MWSGGVCEKALVVWGCVPASVSRGDVAVKVEESLKKSCICWSALNAILCFVNQRELSNKTNLTRYLTVAYFWLLQKLIELQKLI